MTHQLAPYAVQASQSQGRLIPENPCPTRDVFQRDRDRIIHATAFRRLKHKTQVFVAHDDGDHFRTRLTHTLEVAQIARALARSLNVNEDLAECVALAHDLGHPPFGHCGEDVLKAMMAPWGGFNHNDQSLRVVTHLEHRYAAFNGLNLSWEVLEGIAKHNGPVVAGADMPTTAEIDAKFNLRLADYAPLEAQIAAIADDIAYNCHDLDDGLRAKCFSLDDVAQLPLLGPILAELRVQYEGLEPRRLGHEMVRLLMRLLVADVLAHTNQNLAQLKPQSANDVRGAGRVMVWFSPDMWAAVKTLKAFLMQHMYRHYKVNRMNRKMGRVVQDLFEHFMAYPDTLPLAWQLGQGVAQSVLARQALDYVAGTTDRFALEEHKALLG